MAEGDQLGYPLYDSASYLKRSPRLTSRLEREWKMYKIWTNHRTSLATVVSHIGIVLAVTLTLTGGVSQAAKPVEGGAILGTAENFAVLGGQSVTNTGATNVTGNMGVSPGTAITGFPPGILIGETHTADAVALLAQSDINTAWNTLAGQACNTDLTGQDLGGLTLTQGVYCFSSSAQLTGPLILDAQGDPAATWVFQVATGLNTASDASVSVINSGSACNVYWQVGSSATIGANNNFVGNIVALTSISLGVSTDISGRALAHIGSITMETNDLTLPNCATPTAVEMNNIQIRPSTPSASQFLGLGVLGIVLGGLLLKRIQQRRNAPTAQR